MSFLLEEFVLDIWYPHIIKYDLQGLVCRYKHRTRRDITRIEIYKLNIKKEQYYTAQLYISGKKVEENTSNELEKLTPVLEQWSLEYFLYIFFGGF